ncbi:ABC transporter permease [Staphylococcus gallinarum]|uniref:Multidrug ABC transporter ATP-binding protein n=1 Tax=Staphylococcus gallinarum TaxID=1293 RepID=A0ABQ0Y2F6_STAGA|nr:ABC transporter permease [Staphylococcus gallinarum]KIR10517.1 multidrug ABC transporter ATP-binding protein [Staphylococcus gallinarum]MCD8902497.1 ABC transporter permease [Staphylococcus gallinarum]MCD8908575.1 ABC transporter permease [Staphylococcus gallinarum]MCD8919110.1 ABC transporter permease [Staphylococcus gallinarum]MEB6236298.1 ABC transporter permease [Staphylococcus gallinarum]
MTTNAKQLFIQRKREIAKEKRYYNKFIFNGHFSVFLVILLGAFIMGYAGWLQSIPKHINYALIASVVMAVISIFPIRTLLKDADRLFLLPFEKHMSEYMKQSISYSYFTRIGLQILMIVILFPLFYVLNGQTFGFYVIFAILALLLPLLGLVLKWLWYKYKLESWSLYTLLLIIYTSSYYVALGVKSIASIVAVFILIGLAIILYKSTDKHLFPWEKLIKIEQQHHMNYYKFVNMFTDVKHLKETAVRRSYLDPLLTTPKQKKFNAQHMYLYLFTRSFARGKDAFHIILRLVVIAIILIIWLQQPVVALIIGSLFMYIILLQMAQFYTQQAYGLWPQVWPVPDSKVIRGYEQFLNRLMFIIGIIFLIVYFIVNPTYGFAGVIFFLVGWLTVRNVVKKLKYQETLLRD